MKFAWTNSLSVIFGFQSNAAAQALLMECVSFNTKTGEYRIGLNEEVLRKKMIPYLIYWMKQKEFQGIVTGTRSIVFLQHTTKRICFAKFKKTDTHGKCLFLSMMEVGHPFDHESATDVFSRGLFTEFSLYLSKINLLQPQLFNGFPDIPTSHGELVSMQNTFIDPPNRRIVIFLRTYAEKKAYNIVSHALLELNFTCPNSSVPSFTHQRERVTADIQMGYNASVSLILAIHLKEIVSGGLKDVSENYFHSCMQRITSTLAKSALLRSQKYDNMDVGPNEFGEEEQLDLIDRDMEELIPVAEFVSLETLTDN